MVSNQTTLRERIQRTLHPRVAARSLLLAFGSVISLPIVALLVLLVIGIFFGSTAITSAAAAFSQGLGVTAAITLIASIGLLAGTLSIARVQSAAGVGRSIGAIRAMGRTLRTIVPLLTAVVLTALALLLAIAAWLPISLAMLIVAVVLHSRSQRSNFLGGLSSDTRRALIGAVPLTVAVFVLAMVPAIFAASIGDVRGFASLFRAGALTVKNAPVRLSAVVVIIGGASTLLTLAATSVMNVVGVDTNWAVLVGGIGLVILVVIAGTALGLVLPPTPTPRPSGESVVRSRVSTRAPLSARTARVAMVTIIAVMSTFVPAMTASAATPAPSASAVATITPELQIGFDGMGPALRIEATVTVPSGSSALGTVQLLDGGEVVGDPVALSANSSTISRAVLSSTREFDPGTHRFAFRFTAESAAVESGDSPVAEWTYVAASMTTITTPPGAVLDGSVPVTLTISVAPSGSLTTVVPTGTVDVITLNNALEDVQHTLTLVNGNATLTPDEFGYTRVQATYSGSAAFDPSSADVFVDNPAGTQRTELDVSTYNAPWTLGTTVAAYASVTAPDAPFDFVATGRVQVWAGETLLVSPTRVPASIDVPSGTLHAGNNTLRFEFLPDNDSSQTSEITHVVSLEKAVTTVTATQSTAAVARGDAHSITAIVHSDIDGARTVEVRNTADDALIATAPVIVTNGTGTGTVDLAGLLPLYTNTLIISVTADADHAQATADTALVSNISAVRTAMTITQSAPAVVAIPLTFTATLSAPAYPDYDFGTETVDFQLPNSSTTTAVSLVDGAAEISYTPTDRRSHSVIVSYFDSTFAYRQSSASIGFTASPSATGAPTVAYPSVLRPDNVVIDLAYPATGTLNSPTGTVNILDPTDTIVGTGQLRSDGTVTIQALDVGMRPVLRADYLGNSDYAPRTDALTVPALTNYTPTVNVTTPQGTPLGVDFPISIDVSTVPLALVQSVTLSAEGPDGTLAPLGDLSLDSAGHASTTAYLLVAGEILVTATVTYTESSYLDPTTSAARVVSVTPVPVPVLSLSGDTTDLTVGDAFDLKVTTLTALAGSTLTLRDENDRAITATTVSGLTTIFHLTDLPVGPHRLHATVEYGPDRQRSTASSNELEFTLAPPLTYINVTSTSPSAGTDMDVTVMAIPTGGFSGTTRSTAATVTVNEVQRTLTLTRDGATGPFTGTVAFATWHAGFFDISVTTVNDVDTAATSYSGAVQVVPRPTRIVVSVEDARAGFPVTVSAHVVQTDAATGGPAPTGLVTISSWGEYCTVQNDNSCVLPAGSIRVGPNTVNASYHGDADNFGSQAHISVTASERSSSIDVVFSPAESDWIVGQPVTATWTTTTSGADPTGKVVVRVGDTSCTAYTPTGSCTIIVRGTTTQPDFVEWSAKFISADDAPDALNEGSSRTTVCIYPRIWNGIISIPAQPRCNEGGLLYGDEFTVTVTTPSDYEATDWTINGVDVGHAGESSVTLRATGSIIDYVRRYAPQCYTLTMAPLAADRATNKGYSSAFRVDPNCYSTRGPTPQDTIDAAAGRVKFKAGTLVYVDGVPLNRSFDIDTVTGATKVLEASGNVFSVVMDQDVTVTTTFKVKACTPVSLIQSEGGTVAITGAERPSSSGALEPASGACTSRTGEPGYVPGTTLSLSATPGADGAFAKWSTKEWEYPSKPDQDPLNTSIFAVGSLNPDPGVVTGRYEVPSTGVAHVSARFSAVRCVSVITKQWNLVSHVGGALPAHDLILHEGDYRGALETVPARIPQTACGGIATTRDQILTSAGNYRVTTITTSLVNSPGFINVDTDQPTYRYDATAKATGAYAQPAHTLVNWAQNNNAALNGYKTPWRGSEHGPQIELSKVTGGSITIEAVWVADCIRPTVALPQGGGYDVAFAPDEPICGRSSSGVVPVRRTGATLAAQPAPPGTTLTPIFTNLDRETLNGVNVWIADRISSWSPHRYTLEYCAPIGLNVRIVDEAGTSRPLTPHELDTLLEDDGGCPPGWSRPGRVVATGLTAEGSYAYRVDGNSKGLGPLRAVTLTGEVTGPTEMILHPLCFTLSTDEARIVTSGTCPGGASNRFFNGSVVEIQADWSNGRFEGWAGADGEVGETAFVLMASDRSVWADIYHYSWYEKVGNAFSSLAQRLVSTAITVATGLILAELYLVKAVAMVGAAVSMGLRAAGVSGAVLDGLDQGVKIVNAQLTMVSLLSTCTSNFVSGGSALLAQSVPQSSIGAGTQFEAMSTAGQQKLQAKLDAANRSSASNSKVGLAITAINGLGSNLSAYTADAADSWSRGYSQIGSCMQTGAADWARTTSGG